jgi:TRAP-type mannitol/chloroaromatic compound transport system permease large subunit
MLPICGVPLLAMGIDPIWFGVMIGVNLQTSFLTPPFGFTLFYMRNIAPPSITTGDIWIGSIPWTVLQVLGLAVLWAFPATATWLPNAIFRSETPAQVQPDPPSQAPEVDPGDADDGSRPESR